MKKYSIMTKLMISYLFLVLAMALLTGVILLPSQLRKQRQNLDSIISHTAMLLGSNESLAKEASQGFLSETSRRMLDQICASSDKFDYVVLTDSQGIRLYHPDPQKVGKPFSGGDEKEALKSVSSYITTRKGSTDVQKRAFHSLCTSDGAIAGVVMVSASLTTIQREELHTILGLLLILCTILAFGLFFSWFISRNIRKSLLGFEPQTIAQMYLQRDEILDTLNEEILVIKEDDTILYRNEAAGKTFPDVTLPADFPLAFERLSCIQNHQDKQDLLAQYQNRTLLVNLMPAGKKEEPDALLLIIRDRTETTRLAEQLTGTSHIIEALRANTHEYMNKLHVILGLLQIGDTRQAMRFITDVSDDIESGYQAVMRQIKDPSVAALILGKQSHARELDIHFSLRHDAKLPKSNPWISTRDLITIIGNLVENAFEAVNGTEGLRQVELSISCTDQGITISVDDTGHGMTEEQIARIRTGQYTTKGEGHGIGLGLIREIIKKHHGFLDIESEPGEGTFFTVSIGEAQKKGDFNL